jgi:type II secretory pathway pseudopilin PulG
MDCARRFDQDGFTLTEVVFGMLVVTIGMVVCFAAIGFNRVTTQKAKEEAIALDFILHYLETVRGLGFDELRPGAAINQLFDGTGGSPNIRLPIDDVFFPVDTENYRIFHPELDWLKARQPQMRLAMNPSVRDGRTNSWHLHLDVRWNAPLGRGGILAAAMDMVRVRED